MTTNNELEKIRDWFQRFREQTEAMDKLKGEIKACPFVSPACRHFAEMTFSIRLGVELDREIAKRTRGSDDE